MSLSDEESAAWDAEPNAQALPFDTIVETINDGILVCRLGGEIVYANHSIASMLSRSREELVGSMLFDFMDDEWAARARSNLKRRKEGVEEMFDHQWITGDGESIWTLVSAKPMYDDDGEQWGSLVAIQDISERKEMEEELRQARDELESRVEERTRQLVETNQRLKHEVEDRREAEERALEASRAKSAFLANMSHELRTPLNAVIGYTALIDEDLEFVANQPKSLDIGSVREDLGKIHHAGEHLLALINDILDLSKVEAGKMQLDFTSVDLVVLIDEVIETARPMVDENDNRISVQLGHEGELMADRTKLKQVLLNLVGNAAKFTEGGDIRVQTAAEVVDSDRFLRIEVSDTGAGINPDKQQELFEPFTQADNSSTREHGGTGLGLTICKRFTEMMGGHVRLDSEPGEGSTFSVFLPFRRSESEPGETERPLGLAGTQERVIDAAGQRVLVIDDDQNVHELMRRFLQPRGFQVISALDGESGIDLAREALPDVITLDVMMPGRDGWSVLSELKSDPDLASIPVVMVSMVDDKSIGFALGASEYLVKPIERDRLIDVLSRFDEAGDGIALVVEDEDDIRELIQRHLERADWEVHTARDGREALDVLEELQPDVVVLDLMMPGMDGFEVAEKMRKTVRWSQIPIVVVTAMELDEAQRAELRRSVERIMEKDVSSIDEVIQKVLDTAKRSPSGHAGAGGAPLESTTKPEEETMRHTTTNDELDISYRVIGDGNQDLVLVHGWMVSGAVYDDLIAQLDHDKYRLIVPDLRGAGQSSKTAESYRIEDYVGDVMAVAEDAGAQSFGLVGHSMGGQIAQMLAAKYPDRVERMALISPVPAGGISLPDEADQLFFNSGGNRESQDAILDMACLDLDEDRKEEMLDDSARIPAECIQKSYRAWTEGGFSNQLADITAPTLVIASDDPFLPVEFLQEAVVDPIASADLAHVAGAGHYIQVERTDESAELLDQFFS
jgi:PAS domain S-box-containing protein